MSMNELMEKKAVVMGKEVPAVVLIGGALALVTVGAVLVAKKRKTTA